MKYKKEKIVEDPLSLDIIKFNATLNIDIHNIIISAVCVGHKINADKYCCSLNLWKNILALF